MSDRYRWTGRRLLDVDIRTAWYVYKVFRSNTRRSFPGEE